MTARLLEARRAAEMLRPVWGRFGPGMHEVDVLHLDRDVRFDGFCLVPADDDDLRDFTLCL